MRNKKLELVSKNSTLQPDKAEFLQQPTQEDKKISQPEISSSQAQESSLQQPKQKIEKDNPLEIIPKKVIEETPKDNREQWRHYIFHTASALTIGGVGTLFHFLHAPSEVTIVILIIEIIYINRFLIK